MGGKRTTATPMAKKRKRPPRIQKKRRTKTKNCRVKKELQRNRLPRKGKKRSPQRRSKSSEEPMADATQSKSGAGRKVRKAVLPAAGTGGRFLPAPKKQPNEKTPLPSQPHTHYPLVE